MGWVVGLCLPKRWVGITKEREIPFLWARAVRPTRWVYDFEVVGRSKFSTQARLLKSRPREMPYSLSLRFRVFFFFLGLGADSVSACSWEVVGLGVGMLLPSSSSSSPRTSFSSLAMTIS